jgi:hypothetical protein
MPQIIYASNTLLAAYILGIFTIGETMPRATELTSSGCSHTKR